MALEFVNHRRVIKLSIHPPPLVSDFINLFKNSLLSSSELEKLDSLTESTGYMNSPTRWP